MGKRGGKKFGGGRGGRGGGRGWNRPQRTDYEETPKQNELFEKFYNELSIVDESERSAFWAAMRRELPSSFRFTGSKGHALSVQQRLKDHYIPQITSIEHNGELVEPPTPIPWYPDELAWQMTTPKHVIRRFPPFASFQKYLVSETSVGNISRQEVVSMIPPLLMDIRPGMTVLDLCAAPGSKAAQLIEMVHGGEEALIQDVLLGLAKREDTRSKSNGEDQVPVQEEASTSDLSDDGRTTGLLIANDADYKRAHMLIHQMKRLNSPNLIVTNHDATMFPSIKLPSKTPAREGSSSPVQYLKFDRILADVPCSGDGTCRKNPGVWKDWTPGNGLGLFGTQVRILVRALQMLKVGGRVVYSTCSMNPVENEAVIASAIARCGGLTKVDLVDCSASLPELKRKPGLHHWKVMDKKGKLWSSWQEVEEQRAKEGSNSPERIIEGMFPPAKASDQSLEIPFKRCMRVYGHLQDTGAFFITVLEKLLEIRAKPENEGIKPEVRPKSTTSIIAAVDEIEAKPINDANPIEKIDALDAIAPPQESAVAEDPSAAARQNQENIPAGVSNLPKRMLDETDAEKSTKRPKFREGLDEAAPRGEEDRQVHWPPPPRAQLSPSRPESTSISRPVLSSPPKKKSNQTYEEPFKYLDPNHEELQSIYSFYHLSPRFPRDRFMVRNALGNPVKTIYYTSSLARTILVENEGKGMKFVHCGVKMFVKQDVQKPSVCKWRIQTDGLPLLEAWVGEERVVKLWSRDTLRKLLIEMFPKVTGGGWKDLGEIGEVVRDIEMGCCLLRVLPREGEDGFSERMVLPLWRSLHSLNLMLPKEDRKAMLLRLYNDDSPLLDGSKDRFRNKQNGDGPEAAGMDDDLAVDEEDGVDSAGPARPENEEGVVGMEDEDEDEDKVRNDPDAVMQP